ncbi:hypothetical protein GOV11_03105 [Candidatus Woesearchaeota archaeon]|nr:hypothetical protein [Candidatus Woesearchaeota archaeon]
MKVGVIRRFPEEPKDWQEVKSILDDLEVERIAFFEFPTPKISMKDSMIYKTFGSNKNRIIDRIGVFKSQLEYIVEKNGFLAQTSFGGLDGYAKYAPENMSEYIRTGCLNPNRVITLLPMQTTHAAFISDNMLNTTCTEWFPWAVKELGGIVVFKPGEEDSTLKNILIHDDRHGDVHINSTAVLKMRFTEEAHKVRKIRVGTEHSRYKDSFKHLGHSLKSGKPYLVNIGYDDIAVLNGYCDPPEIGFFSLVMRH